MQAIEIVRFPFIVVVSGPSGVGKSTVVDRILERASGFVASISVTTRAPRGDERNGVDYRFVSREVFGKMRERDEFLEWAEVHGNLYGTPGDFVFRKMEEGVNVLLEIDVQGGARIKERYPDSVLIFLLPPSFDTLRQRLQNRATDNEEEVRRRLDNARLELSSYTVYDYIVINDDLSRCVEDCLAILKAETLRRERASFQIKGLR